MQGVCKLIDVCQTYQGMSELTRGTLYLLATNQMPASDASKWDRGAILWWLREVDQFLELEQDTVRMEIEELRTRLERED